MKKVSVVILNWNGKGLLQTFLPSVLEYTPPELAEVVVADNGSTDDSLEMLRENFPEVKIITFDKNYGFAEGYNRAIEQIDTDYTVLLNSDVEVTSEWLTTPVQLLDKDDSVAAIQPKIRAQRNKVFFEYAGAAGGYLDRYGYPFCRGRVLHVIEEDKGQYDEPADILWASGACLIIRTSVYKKEGGLDGQFFAHQEEVDLCWRLRCRGYRLVCLPESVVYHVGGATLNAENPRKTYLNFRNSLLMVYKNTSDKEIGHVLQVRFWLDYIAACKFLLTGQFGNAKAVYKARKAFHEMRDHYQSIRQENIQKTVLLSIPEVMQVSLIKLFYLKGKKRFIDLLPFLKKSL